MYIHIVYINAHIHQGFEPKNSWRCTKVLTTKSFQDFNIKGIFLIKKVWHEFFSKIQTLIYFLFFKIYSNPTNENMILKIIL
jgi:hypothetical protein